MTPKLKDWRESGHFISKKIYGYQVFVKELGDSLASSERTLLLLHGFPESSFSFHEVVDGLLEVFDRIILFDMIGYGFNDKPGEEYSYSLIEQADTAFEVWEHFGIKGGHIIAHDMGNSVTTEIIARHETGLMPSFLSDGFRSITFTNGSIVLEFTKLRITQKLLKSNYGYFIKDFTFFPLFKHQIKSAQGNDNLSEESIQSLWDTSAIQDGHKKLYLTVRYLNDRKKFEKTRWVPALSKTKIPIHLCWGDMDQVAQVEIAKHLKAHVCKEAHLTLMKGLGHFCQLENPQKWLKYITRYYSCSN